MQNKTILLVLLGALGACSGESEEQQMQVSIDSQPSVCIGESQQRCLRVQREQEQQWSLHYGGIEGFDYQWGFAYILAVTEIEVGNPPADGSSIQWVLLDVIVQDEDDIGTEYLLEEVSMQESTITYINGEYSFMGYPFVCAEGLNCDSLFSLGGSNQVVDLTFRYLGNAQVELAGWQ